MNWWNRQLWKLYGDWEHLGLKTSNDALSDFLKSNFKIFFFGYAACLWDCSSPISNWTQPLPVEAWNPKHWTAREFPKNFLFNYYLVSIYCVLSALHINSFSHYKNYKGSAIITLYGWWTETEKLSKLPKVQRVEPRLFSLALWSTCS